MKRIYPSIFALLILAIVSSVAHAAYVQVGVIRSNDQPFDFDGYLIWLDVELDDNSASSVSITLPDTTVISLPYDSDNGMWGDEFQYGTIDAINSAFNGTWTVTVTGGSQASTSTFTMNLSGASELTASDFFSGPPVITFPAHDASNVPTTNPTFTWDAPTGGSNADALVAMLEADDGEFFEFLSPSATSWSPSSALALGEYEFSILYANFELARITALEVQSGSITWDKPEYAPEGFEGMPFFIIGSEHIISFTVVPEPATASLLLGAALLALRRRRR